jgi:seryl-tRNA synthetase
MHDLKAIRDGRDGFVRGLKRRGLADAENLADGILAQDRALRELLTRKPNATTKKHKPVR